MFTPELSLEPIVFCPGESSISAALEPIVTCFGEPNSGAYLETKMNVLARSGRRQLVSESSSSASTVRVSSILAATVPATLSRSFATFSSAAAETTRSCTCRVSLSGAASVLTLLAAFVICARACRGSLADVFVLIPCSWIVEAQLLAAFRFTLSRRLCGTGRRHPSSPRLSLPK